MGRIRKPPDGVFYAGSIYETVAERLESPFGKPPVDNRVDSLLADLLMVFATNTL